jgi:transcriptional regulator with XRE-family HTH domain
MNHRVKDLQAGQSPKVFDTVEKRAEEPVTAMALDALRDARQLTQVQLAQLLRVSQGAVSKVERRSDMFVSTLRSYVRAIGGDLEIRAVFPDGKVLIDQFNDLSAARPAELKPPDPGSHDCVDQIETSNWSLSSSGSAPSAPGTE